MAATCDDETAIILSHALGCSSVGRDACCSLSGSRIAYSVGCRVVITAPNGDTRRLSFVPRSQACPAERVSEITALAADASQRHIACCYVVEHQPDQAHVAVYHLSSGAPACTATITYRRPAGASSVCTMRSAQAVAPVVAAALPCRFVSCSFSTDSRTLLTLTNAPQHTLTGYDWRGGSTSK
jgi:hypothetical protein